MSHCYILYIYTTENTKTVVMLSFVQLPTANLSLTVSTVKYFIVKGCIIIITYIHKAKHYRLGRVCNTSHWVKNKLHSWLTSCLTSVSLTPFHVTCKLSPETNRHWCFVLKLTVVCYFPKPLMRDLMCSLVGIWQAVGATAGLHRPPMRNWSDNHSRVNHFHKLITLGDEKCTNSEVSRGRGRSVHGSTLVTNSRAQFLHCLRFTLHFNFKRKKKRSLKITESSCQTRQVSRQFSTALKHYIWKSCS